jgi:hypothetical protein
MGYALTIKSVRPRTSTESVRPQAEKFPNRMLYCVSQGTLGQTQSAGIGMWVQGGEVARPPGEDGEESLFFRASATGVWAIAERAGWTPGNIL